MKSLLTIFLVVVILSLSKDLRAALTVTNTAATNITATAATIGGSLTATNGLTVTNILYWGTINQTTNAASWQAAFTNFAVQFGAWSTNLTGLTSGRRYYYRASSVDTTGVAWASATGTFTTLANAPTNTPTVSAIVPLMVNTNGTIVAPSAFIAANNLTSNAAGSALATNIAAVSNRVSVIENIVLFLTNNCTALTGGAVTLDAGAGMFSRIILTNHATWTLTNFTGVPHWVKIQQDDTGGWTNNWPFTLLWSSNSVMEASTNAGSADIVKILYDGQNYFADIIGQQYRDRPLARFEVTPKIGPSPLLVTFTNTTLGPFTAAVWDFGDGVTSNTTATVVEYTYSSNDTFLVSLLVSNHIAGSTASNTVSVTGASYGLRFNGTNAVNCGSLTHTGEWTVEGWLKWTANADGGRMISWANGARAITQRPGGEVAYEGGGYLPSGSSKNDGNWHHVAVTFTNDTVELYVDGVSQGTVGTSDSDIGGVMAIGQNASETLQDEFEGWLYSAAAAADEIRISTVVRYTGNFTPAAMHILDSETLVYYRLNEGSGTTAADATLTYDGTLYGQYPDGPEPEWVEGVQ